MKQSNKHHLKIIVQDLYVVICNMAKVIIKKKLRQKIDTAFAEE